MNSKKTEPH